MDRYKNRIATVIFIIITLAGCLDPYEPPVTEEDSDVLVIHGNINSTDNSATVTLTRSVNLSDSSKIHPETGADVLIEDQSGQRIKLNEKSAGVYTVNDVFSYNKQYRLSVTAQGKKYYSEFIQLERANEMDSLTWTVDDTKFEVFANTHDFSEGAKYYRYAFEETHEYRTFYTSHYHFVNGEIKLRSEEESIFQCWTTKTSGSILLASTENLTQNSISGFQITRIEKGDNRLSYDYTILVKQIALSKSAYDYWTQLKKTTESLGGLFDPIPSSINGNVSSESNAKVMGYFSGGDVSEKRIIVNGRSLPKGYINLEPQPCDEKMIPLATVNTLDGAPVLLTVEWGPTTLLGYFYTTPECADCRLKGGTNKKPDFLK